MPGSLRSWIEGETGGTRQLLGGPGPYFFLLCGEACAFLLWWCIDSTSPRTASLFLAAETTTAPSRPWASLTTASWASVSVPPIPYFVFSLFISSSLVLLLLLVLVRRVTFLLLPSIPVRPFIQFWSVDSYMCMLCYKNGDFVRAEVHFLIVPYD